MQPIPGTTATSTASWGAPISALHPAVAVASSSSSSPALFAQPALGTQPATDAAAAAAKSRQNRIVRACDLCRRRKVRPVKRPAPKGYVEGLERRLEAMEGLLSSLSARAGVDPPTRTSPLPPLNTSAATAAADMLQSAGVSPTQQLPPDSSRPPTPPPTDLDAIHSLSERLDDLAVDADRYVGRGSGLHLVESVHAYVGQPTVGQQMERPSLADHLLRAQHQRVAFSIPPPPADLSQRLIDAFFSLGSIARSIIHKQYFDECVSKGMVESDASFRGLYYALCALGARFVDDARLDPPADPACGPHEPGDLRLARGYAYFAAIWGCEKDPFSSANLFDLQQSVISLLWLFGATGYVTSWTVIGFAVRRAVDVGAHRETRTRWTHSPLQDQLRRRSFHLLTSFDRYISAALGRPVALPDDEMDVAPPLEISDDALWAWELAAQAAARRGEATVPPHPPLDRDNATAYGWECGFALHRIMGRALKLMYGLKRDNDLETTAKNVAELDGMLNAWLQTIPARLQCEANPAKQSDEELAASTWFVATYYQTQILIHREFFPPIRSRALGFNSLAICSNAARATANVLDTLRQRGLLAREWIWAPHAAVTSGLTLLLGVFANPLGPSGSARATLSASAASDVKRCINALESLSSISFVARQCYHGLTQLALASAVPPPPGAFKAATEAAAAAAAAAGGALPSPTSAAKASLKRQNPGEWNDGRSPVDSSAGASSDKPSPADSTTGAGSASGTGCGSGPGASECAAQGAHKSRRLDPATMPFSTEDLSSSTFKGRATFLARSGSGSQGGQPQEQQQQQQQQQQGSGGGASEQAASAGKPKGPPVGLAYMPDFGAEGLFVPRSDVLPTSAPTTTAASAATSAPATSVAFDASAYLQPASSAPPLDFGVNNMAYPSPSFLGMTDMWSLPFDTASSVPPAVNAATGELLSTLGIPPFNVQTMQSGYGSATPGFPLTVLGNPPMAPPPPASTFGMPGGAVPAFQQPTFGAPLPPFDNSAPLDPATSNTFDYDANIFGGLSPFGASLASPQRRDDMNGFPSL
ncbi:hypothetical protein Rhopal_000262-T1 [Rhodotorula paludigena]|uniref:Xylanolytic transcriptional activator regulatory domain-containing protein n=1 Tax=Rhodotorula paludigena TaxID=86838 RepID=A0AAV5GBU0_9BASI|nr:hypothetical protein Rhopal_000262-T1 [Rhodotorula paludigena]